MPKIKVFKGLVTDADAGDLPGGAASDQTNLITTKYGEISPREGIQPATFSSEKTIGTGYHTFQKMCFCKTRTGEVIGVNGIDRGLIWDGVADTAVDLGINEPSQVLSITRSSILTISAVADSTGSNGPYRITTSTDHGFSTGDEVLIGGIVSTGAMAGDLNGGTFEVTQVSATQFDVDDTSFDGARVGGGACSASGTGATKGTYKFAYRFVDNSSKPTVSSLSTENTVKAFTADKFVWNWSGAKASSESRVDRYELWRTTSGVSNVYYKIAKFAISGNIRMTLASGGKLALIGDSETWAVGQKITIANSSKSYMNVTCNITEEVSTNGGQMVLTDVTIPGGEDGTGGGTGITFTHVSYEDTFDDPTLNLSVNEDVLLVLLNPPTDNTLVARRFTPPPNDMAYVVMFQDRYFYFGVVKYNKGTARSLSGGLDRAVEGSGTEWTESMVGRYMEIDGVDKPIKITGYASATKLYVSEYIQVASLTNYTIYPPKQRRRQIYYSYQDEPESVPSTNTMTLQENSGDDDEIVGAMPYGPYLYILSQRHKYALSYSQEPVKDGSIRFLDDRGAFNHYCWDYFENVAYLMDDSGCYVFDGTKSESISESIHDIFRKDGTGDKIDFTKSQNFFVKADRLKEKVYFFVCFVGDTGNHPKRALVYNIKRETFDPMEYATQITSAASVEKDGQPRVLFSSENSSVYMADAGATDVVTSEIKGVVDSAASGSLTDSSATFTSACVNAFVYIYDGTGKGQKRTVIAQSSTALTVSPNWTTTPDSTSKYIVGAIPWNWKTGSFPIEQTEEREAREVSIEFSPIDGEQSCDVRLYMNNDESPVEFAIAQKLGDGVEIKEEHKQDVVINMDKDASILSESTGKESFSFDGMSSGMAQSDHKVAIEIRGYGSDKTPKIREVDIKGVGSSDVQ